MENRHRRSWFLAARTGPNVPAKKTPITHMKLHLNGTANRRMSKDDIASLILYKIERIPPFDIRHSLFDIPYSLFQEFLLSIKLAAQASGGAESQDASLPDRCVTNLHPIFHLLCSLLRQLPPAVIQLPHEMTFEYP